MYEIILITYLVVEFVEQINIGISDFQQLKSEMGSEFGKTMDLMFITANEICYPPNAPANTPNKSSPEGNEKYNILSTKNLTDNQGWLPVDIDYTKFKPKKYYLDKSDEQVQKHLNALEKQEKILKRFKHSEDFDRLDYDAEGIDYPTFQTDIERNYITHFAFCAIFSRIITVQIYFHKYSHTLLRNTFVKVYSLTFALPYLISLFSQQAQPVNHEYFRTMPKQVRTYQGLAYDLDAYQYVNDIKYNYKYPEMSEYQQTLQNVRQKIDQSMHHDAIKYFKRMYGIIDPEPYLNHNKNQSEEKQKN